jgi:hypothetical protein
MNTIGPERLEFLEHAVDQTFDGETVASKEARGWGTNDSDFEAYCVDLALPDNPEGLGGIIEAQIGRSASNVGIDLAGGTEGVALRDLLRMGLLGKALVTNYATKPTEDDPRLDHIEGDLADRDTWTGILDWQQEHASDGLDLVMHRPVGGLQNFSPFVYTSAANLLLDMIKPGGVMFCQVPRSLTQGSGQLGLRIVCRRLAERDDIEEIIPSFVYPRHEEMKLDSTIIIKKP